MFGFRLHAWQDMPQCPSLFDGSAAAIEVRADLEEPIGLATAYGPGLIGSVILTWSLKRVGRELSAHEVPAPAPAPGLPGLLCCQACLPSKNVIKIPTAT